ncbi:hypothetical protein [Ammoniphilus sp. YIM 78166]|uniref:hypothetical protein n=1 Tax=Ammoniphilus sp. YIM 78166 TaxID=1644106 RepID=UPI00107056AC|nr:hypothetical protein [Ammoniphilus sp. YIM 78166]
MCKSQPSLFEVRLAMAQLQKLVEHVEVSTDQWKHYLEKMGALDGGPAFSTAIQKAQELQQSLGEIQRQMQDVANAGPLPITVKRFK